MGGLINFLPFTYICIFFASLAITGFPFLTGFYSKDLLLELINTRYVIDSDFIYFLSISAAFFTALYSIRMIIYVFGTKNVNLYKTYLGGAGGNWSQVTGFSGNINCIAVNPTDDDKIAIATTGNEKVYVSNNGGATWTSYKFNLPNFSALALVWENNGKDGLYLGMNYGVYYIDNDSGNQWKPFSNNLPNVEISELEINYADGKLYAGTYGRGAWRTNLYDPNLSVADLQLNNIKVYPNPATKEVNLSWNKGDEVDVRIYNSLGKLMYYSKNKSLINPLKIDVSPYASGLYFVKMNNQKGVVTKKMIVN